MPCAPSDWMEAINGFFRKVFRKLILVMAFVSYASAAPVSLDTGLHRLVSRGLVSPSNAELLHNTIAFGVPAVLAYLLRM